MVVETIVVEEVVVGADEMVVGDAVVVDDVWLSDFSLEKYKIVVSSWKKKHWKHNLVILWKMKIYGFPKTHLLHPRSILIATFQFESVIEPDKGTNSKITRAGIRPCLQLLSFLSKQKKKSRGRLHTRDTPVATCCVMSFSKANNRGKGVRVVSCRCECRSMR